MESAARDGGSRGGVRAGGGGAQAETPTPTPSIQWAGIILNQWNVIISNEEEMEGGGNAVLSGESLLVELWMRFLSIRIFLVWRLR